MKFARPFLALLLFGCLPPSSVAPAPAPAPAEEPVIEAAPAPTPEPPAAENLGDDYCQVEVSGASVGKSSGKGGVDSDHFYNETELRERISGADPEVIEQFMRNDPHLHLLLLYCRTPLAEVHFRPGSQMNYANLPFGPGKYDLGSDEHQIGGSIHSSELETYFEIEYGTLEITRFDGRGIAASFTLHAKDALGDPGSLDIKGSLAFPCQQGTAICGGRLPAP